MKAIIATTTAILTAFSFSMAAKAENLEHLNRLLSTKQCPLCDLSGAGLVMVDLSGAKLIGANLAGANLSQANLSGADLSGANLSGASLHGANLIGANLSSAILNGTDLREAYLSNAIIVGTKLDAAYVQGAEGIPNNAGTRELFYEWGLIETKQGNYQKALDHYNKALLMDAEYAPVYLARAYALLRLGNEAGATENAAIASQLFAKQENPQGQEMSDTFVKNLETFQEVRKKEKEGNNAQLDNFVRGAASLMLRLFLGGM
ncbi:pentapeptide repeat protein [Rippkaea orientalis PCC 8801]|uniref:Pentapeptide repeat protein n=1 Tax=Rippkaea orientalis (strain PCC 8801 / RF-1) TaxID=41431 RepID=B7K635_RIPO1|nr:pentapeptide repeat-containing protein [Rippkaea orientalis]ACK68088.1 pentapeptide repeat protein [Rippkaea orientalis PCC 8801]